MKKDLSLNQLQAIYTVYKDLNINTRTVNCCTCGRPLFIQDYTDCYNLLGHYIPRSVNHALKYYPENTHAQCAQCNVFNNGMFNEHTKYMVYRYGDDIKQRLADVKEETEDYYKNFYITELLKLSSKFPELLDLLVDENTGEIKRVDEVYENKIEEQFNTYSPSYRSDLDILCKALKTSPIEWEKLS